MNEPEKDNVARPQFGKIEGGKQSIFLGDNDIRAVIERVSLADFESLKLSEPKFGDTVIGEINDEECIRFARFHAVMARRKELDREIGGSQIEEIGKRIRSGDINENDNQVDMDSMIDHDLAKEYFRVNSYLEKVKSELFHPLADKFNVWEFKLGVRTKRRVVKAQRRY